jgi:peptidylprolyl isomerase
MKTRSVLATAALLPTLLLGGSVLAQDAKPPETQPAPQTIDPDARKTLETMAAAHYGLKSFSAKVSALQQQGERKQATEGSIAFSRPGKARASATTVGATDGARTVITDGASVFNLEESAKRYQQNKATGPADQAIAAAINESRALALPLFGLLTFEKSEFDKLMPGAATSMTLERGGTADGVAVDKVRGTLSGIGGQPGVTILYTIGAEDHLLRQVELSATIQNQSFIIREDFSEVKANPELSATLFALPEGATKIEAPTPPAAPKKPLPPLPANAKTITTPSGLKYVDIVVGTGPVAKNGKSVSVHYTGTLTDGTRFDSSKDRGQPFSLSLPGGVIAGWNEGLLGMKVGGKRRLIIPAKLGYGANGTPGGPIPPNATLLFDIELLGVK